MNEYMQNKRLVRMVHLDILYDTPEQKALYSGFEAAHDILVPLLREALRKIEFHRENGTDEIGQEIRANNESLIKRIKQVTEG